MNEKLHLVIPIYQEADGVEVVYAYVHAAPVSREVFEANFRNLSKTFAAIHGEGLGELAGPRIAALMLREVARDSRDEEGARALMNEIRRLSNILIRTPAGWETMPFADAIEHLDPDDVSEVENAIVYFIVSSAMHRKNMAKLFLTGAAKLWGAEVTSLDFTAFVASQKTSTTVAPTSENRKLASSVPR